MGRRKKRIYGEGTVSLRKDGRYQISVPGMDGKRRYAYAESEKEAEKERRRLLLEVEEGKTPASKQLFQQHVREWLEMKEKMKRKGAGYKPNTYLSTVYRMDAYFVPALGHLPLSKITPRHIQKLINQFLDDGLHPNTVNHYYATLHTCLESAVKQGKINFNPCNRVELPKKVKSKNNFLSQEEALQLLDAVRNHQLFSVLIPLALATEARLSELLALTWTDINLEQGLVSINKTLTKTKDAHGKLTLLTVTPKSDSGKRDILLPDFAIQALRSHQSSQRKQLLAGGRKNHLNLVFLQFSARRVRDHFAPDNVSETFNQFAKRLGFAITFHDLRHTGATLLLESGVDAKTVSERLGHSDVTVTMNIYGHVTKKMKDRSAHTLNNLFADQQKGKNEAI
jgi:integrase